MWLAEGSTHYDLESAATLADWLILAFLLYVPWACTVCCVTLSRVPSSFAAIVVISSPGSSWTQLCISETSLAIDPGLVLHAMLDESLTHACLRRKFVAHVGDTVKNVLVRSSCSSFLLHGCTVMLFVSSCFDAE